MKKTLFTTSILLIVLGININAQEQPADTLAPIVEKLQSDVALSKKLKISGYIQAQWQKADTIGSPAKYSAGDFTGLDNRYKVRRGRIKFAYSNDLSQYVLQFDVSENGLAIKDAYGSFTDKWLKMFTLTAGAFNRPFGYEVSFSSSSLESPERARVIQALFPNEEDLGSQLAIQFPGSSPLSFIKLQGGMFTGNGLGTETDKYKDFIGQVIMKKSLLSESLLLSGGVSYYNGGFAALSPDGKNDSKLYAYQYKYSDAGFVKDSVTAGAKLKREYIGVDAQASFKTFLGYTTLRGEYVMGTQPGTDKVNYSPTSAYAPSAKTTTTYAVVVDTTTASGYRATATSTTVNTLNYYSRSFAGGYVMLAQSIADTKHEIVAKYDWYDPNTKVSGDEIGQKANTSAADIKFSTIGLGWNYYWNSNIKLTAYYEMVTNEKSANIAATALGTTNYRDNLKDNVLTLRLQVKF
jgi:hypothetical protein